MERDCPVCGSPPKVIGSNGKFQHWYRCTMCPYTWAEDVRYSLSNPTDEEDHDESNQQGSH